MDTKQKKKDKKDLRQSTLTTGPIGSQDIQTRDRDWDLGPDQRMGSDSQGDRTSEASNMRTDQYNEVSFPLALFHSRHYIYIYISYQTYHISGLRYTTILLVLKYETIMVKRPPNSQSTCSSEYELKPDIESDENDDENEIKAKISKANSPKKARVQKSPLKPKKDSTPVRHIPPKNHS